MPYFLTLLLMIIPLTASAEIYTWKDANGVTHFAQEKPADQEAESVVVEEQQISTQPDATTPATESTMMPEDEQTNIEQPTVSSEVIEPEQPQDTEFAEKNNVADFIEKNNDMKPNEGTATTELVEAEQKSAAQYIEANKGSKPAGGLINAE